MVRQSTDRLHLHEEILLLALRDEKGSFHQRTYQPAVAGAVLAELVLKGRIAISGDAKALVEVVDARPLGEPLLDEVLTRIRTAKRRASAKTWVSRINALSRLPHRVASGLCRRGVLRAEEDRILLIFRRRLYPEVNPVPEHKLIQRLQQTIFGDGREIDARTAVLVSLANAANLLSVPFDRRDLKKRKTRIASIVQGEILGKATREVIAAARAAQVAIGAGVVAAMASRR